MDQIEYHITTGRQLIITEYKMINIFAQGILPLEISNYFGWFKIKTYIDYAFNDYFGKNVSIVEYPKNILFNSSMYVRRIEYIKSFINNSKPKIYIVIKTKSKSNFILSRFIEVLERYQHKSINLFTEYILFINYMSYFPRIWYNGSVYLEIYKENIIYGYIRIIYITCEFFKNREYNKYNPVIIQ